MQKAITQLKSCHNVFVFARTMTNAFQNMVRLESAVQYSLLPNGVPVASDERPSWPTTCFGLFFNAGPRYENKYETGLTNFFQHLVYQETCKYAKSELFDKMQETGGRFKCHTTRDMAAFYVECLNSNVKEMFGILCDGILQNTFAGLEDHVCVVLSEMCAHDSNYQKVLFDLLHETAFQGTNMMGTVAGPSYNLPNFTESVVKNFVNRTFRPPRVAVASAGGTGHEELVSIASCFLNMPPTHICPDLSVRYTGSEIRSRDDSRPLGQVAIAVEAPNFRSNLKTTMEVACEILSGWDASQPSGQNHGVDLARYTTIDKIIYAYKAFYWPYRDTGLWGVHYMAKSIDLEDVLFQVQSEMMLLCYMVADGDLERAQRALVSRALSRFLNISQACNDMGKQLLYANCVQSLDDRISDINRVRVDDLMETCSQYIYDKCPAIAAVGATEGLPDYTRIRAGMYRLRM